MTLLISYRIALRMVKATALLTRTDLPYPLPDTRSPILPLGHILWSLLKGVYHIRPPVPRYSTTWDVTELTSYLKTLFPLYQLSLKNFTSKTVMICGLSSDQREQTNRIWELFKFCLNGPLVITWVGLFMSKVREKYWIPKLRALAKRVLRHRYGCKRFHTGPEPDTSSR